MLLENGVYKAMLNAMNVLKVTLVKQMVNGQKNVLMEPTMLSDTNANFVLEVSLVLKRTKSQLNVKKELILFLVK